MATLERITDRQVPDQIISPPFAAEEVEVANHPAVPFFQVRHIQWPGKV